jgi:hypothetical protein
MSQLRCRFKLAYTGIVYEYDININDSAADVYQQFTDQISRDFEVNDFHIVLAGQQSKEEADAIPKTSIRPFYDFLGGQIHGSFYIRKNVTRTILDNNLDQTNVSRTSTIGSCSVCLMDNIRVCSFYSCTHLMCANCNELWRISNRSNMNNYRCPECRSN